MNHALLKSVIYDQHEFIRNFQIVPRDYEFEENGNYVLVGLRRAGKSTLLYKIVLDLVASGVEMEAESVEDEGAGVCFHVYVYNVQPGIDIDYRTGENKEAVDYEKYR